MKTPKTLGIAFAGKKNDVITFNCGNNDIRIRGASLPLSIPKNQSISSFSFSLPKNKTSALLFLDRGFINSETFLFLEQKNEQWRAYVDKIPTFPYDMFVVGDDITLDLNDKIVSTGNKPGVFKVTYDAMCKFLIQDITEEELLAEAVKLEEKLTELESLHKYINELKGQIEHLRKEKFTEGQSEIKRLQNKLRDKDDVLEYIFHIAHNSWSPFYSRISLIRKQLPSLPELDKWNPKK